MSSSEGKGLSIAEDFVSSMIADPISKIVIFGLQWCEFSWSLRKFLNAHVLIHKSLELDSAAFIESCDPDDAQTVLKRPIGTPTIPQLFVAGRHVGGCTDVFNAWHDGRLQSVLGTGKSTSRNLDRIRKAIFRIGKKRARRSFPSQRRRP
jgi:glutaredoxin-related protein